MAKHKVPYTFPHKSRAAMVQYICGIGGYSDQRERWPIEFTVDAGGADLDFDTLWDRATQEGEIIADVPILQVGLYKDCFREVWEEHRERLWEWGVEEAVESLKDADTYRMLWDGETTLKLEFELRGRGGKHLVLTDFEGMVMAGIDSDTLRERLMMQTAPNYRDEVNNEPRLRKGWEWAWPLSYVTTLYRYCRQCEIDFTPEKAAREVEYRAMWRLARFADDLYDQRVKEIADKEKLTEHAVKVGQFIFDGMQDAAVAVESFKHVLRAAGLNPTDILPE